MFANTKRKAKPLKSWKGLYAFFRAFPLRLLKNLTFTISKSIFITYNTSLYNISYIKTSIFLTLHLNIISLLFFIISHSPLVSLSHCLSIFLNPVKLLPPSNICSQNLHGLSFSSSSPINHGHSHSHSHHHQPPKKKPTAQTEKLLPLSDICSQNLHGLSFSSSSPLTTATATAITTNHNLNP